MTIYQETCRVCNSSLVDVLNLGNLYPSNFVDVKEVHMFEKAPLVLAECENCGLVQLRHTVDLDTMYRQYFYQSSLNKSMVRSLSNVADEIVEFVTINPNDTIIDIGCNDGTFFSFFPDDIFKIGFDPALNLKKYAEKTCDVFINDYFSTNLLTGTKAKLITAIAMFYDLPSPIKFAKDVVDVLADDGVFVVQFTDLRSMLEINAVDNLCHEHLEYYRLQDVINILEQVGLKVFHVSRNDTNGGSIRIFASKGSYDVRNSVELELQEEKHFFIHDSIKKFSHRINAIKEKFMQFLRETNSFTIYGLGASTKGNTLLQYFGITPSYIEKIGEVNSDKFGKVTLGTNIPIIPESQALEENPTAFLILPWHFIKSFLASKSDYINNGGILIVPLPEPGFYFKKDNELAFVSILNL